MRKSVIAAVATVAVAAPLGLFATAAQAAPTPTLKEFCTRTATQPQCSVSVPIGTLNEGVTEGTAVKAQLTGAAGKSFDFAVFRVDRDASGRPTGLTRLTQPVKTTIERNGYGSVTIPIPVLKAPFTGLDDGYVVALADTRSPDQVLGTATGKVDVFDINSHRAMWAGQFNKPRNGRFWQPGESIAYQVKAGIPGDTYVVEMQRGKDWVNVMDGRTPNNGVITQRGKSALLFFEPKDWAPGKYPTRVRNTGTGYIAWQGDFVMLDPNGQLPTAAPKPTTSVAPKPSASATPKPSTSAAPKPSTSASPKPSASVTAKPSRPGTPVATPTPSTSTAPSVKPAPTTAAPTDPAPEPAPEPTADQNPAPAPAPEPAPAQPGTEVGTDTQAPADDVTVSADEGAYTPVSGGPKRSSGPLAKTGA